LARSETPDDQAEISGDLFSVLKELEGRVRLLIQTTMRPTEGFGEKLYAFADHVEIQSPGGLYGEATPENFPTRNSYRNPIIAEAMKSLGFVNRFGYGVQRAQALLEKNGNPPASYAFDDRSVLVKVYRRQP
jgi:ATP-dependent DNA helicase RecG